MSDTVAWLVAAYVLTMAANVLLIVEMFRWKRLAQIYKSGYEAVDAMLTESLDFLKELTGHATGRGTPNGGNGGT